jgi:hypothetical protein
MHMKNLIITLVLVFSLSSGIFGQDLIIGLKNTISWGRGQSVDKKIDLKFKSQIKPTSLTVGLDTPNGIKLKISFEKQNVAVDLRYIISMNTEVDDFAVLNEFGDLKDGCWLNVGTYDFEGDGNPEIVIAIGDLNTRLRVNVIKYHPPENGEDAIRPENWSVLGNFTSGEDVKIEGNIVTMPYGSYGLYHEQTFVNGKFLKSN